MKFTILDKTDDGDYRDYSAVETIELDGIPSRKVCICFNRADQYTIYKIKSVWLDADNKDNRLYCKNIT